MHESLSIVSRLDALRQTMPEPFMLDRQARGFLVQPLARELLESADGTEQLLAYLEGPPLPSLARVAVMLLSCCTGEPVYRRMLAVLERADQVLTEAFEPGFWWRPEPPAQMAHDLVALVHPTHHPSPLLLLQRPVAGEVRDALEQFIRLRRMPLSAYALYAYAYVPEPRDRALLELVAGWLDEPVLCSNAGLQLLSMGDGAGKAGIRAGLQAADRALREITYQRLGPCVAGGLARAARYDPGADPASQRIAVDRLIDGIGPQEAHSS